jgi:hypothetical protein
MLPRNYDPNFDRELGILKATFSEEDLKTVEDQ